RAQSRRDQSGGFSHRPRPRWGRRGRTRHRSGNPRRGRASRPRITHGAFSRRAAATLTEIRGSPIQDQTGPVTMSTPIYMCYHATTRVTPAALEAMLPFCKENFGNAASRNHPFGWDAESAVEAAREQVAKLVGASAKEITFTAGASESNNLAIKGVLEF